jgi:pyocin large subunit-like protein
MSSPPLKAPPLVRLLSLLVVIAAVVVRFWPHAPQADVAATPAVVATVARAPAAVATAPVRRYGATIGFRTGERLQEHFRKHGPEFRAASAAAYLELAQALRDRPAGGEVLERVRADGVVSRFDRATGAFLAFDVDGTIRTFFRPNDGERYFERQAERPRGAP